MSPGVQAKRVKSKSESQHGESVTQFFMAKIPIDHQDIGKLQVYDAL
jgi:hypothetical protein